MEPSGSFSVALCTYNGAKFLADQLESIARQQQLPAELILCDDQSTDETLAIAEAFARQAPFPVRVTRNSRNLGYAANFRQALALCKSDLLAFADQDDIWHPQKLQRLGQTFAQAGEQVGGVFSDGDLIDPKGKPLPGTLWGSFKFTAREQQRFVTGEAIEVLVQRNVVTGMAFATRRRWAHLLHNLPASWPHDAWLALLLADRSRIIPCPERLVAYRVHGTQQIGVPITRAEKVRFVRERGISAYLALSRERNLGEYNREARQFDALLEVLRRSGEGSPKLMQEARGKAEHAHTSSELLQGTRGQRWRTVLARKEKYRRYSPTGINAMLRDLLI